MSDDIALIPITFSFLEKIPLDPRMANTPLWKEAPLAPARFVNSYRFGASWVVDVCPYCGDKHTHGAETDKRDDDPRTVLGGRLSHCTKEPWASVSCEYRLIGIQGRAPSKKELRAHFPKAIAAYCHHSKQWHYFSDPHVHLSRDDNPRSSIRIIRRPISRDLRSAVWNKSLGKCWYCGIQTNPFDNFAVDHLVPVADGGTNEPSNLVPACAACNGAKGAMSLTAFRAKRGGGLFWFEIAFTGGSVLLP